MTMTDESSGDFTFPPPAHSIRNSKKGTENYEKKPDYLTLMAIGFDNNKQMFWTRTYRTPVTSTIDEAGRKEAETRLANFAIWHVKADMPYPNDISRVSRNVEGIDFIGPSYFTVVICWDGWAFVDDEAKGLDPLRFWKEKTGTSIRYANASFFDAEMVPVKTSKGVFNAVRCINHVKDDDGSDVPQRQDRHFGFDIYLTIPLSGIVPASAVDSDAILPSRVVIIIDPTGDNKGPP